jgi:hypothetical protein
MLDKNWANRVLSYNVNLLYDRKTWDLPHNKFNKIIVVRSSIDLLETAGYWWQAETLASHLHRFLKSFTAPSISEAPTASPQRGAST